MIQFSVIAKEEHVNE